MGKRCGGEGGKTRGREDEGEEACDTAVTLQSTHVNEQREDHAGKQTKKKNLSKRVVGSSFRVSATFEGSTAATAQKEKRDKLH